MSECTMGWINKELREACMEVAGIKDFDPYETWKENGFDSLDVVELLMECEERFDIEISDEEAELLTTPQKALDRLYEVLNKEPIRPKECPKPTVDLSLDNIVIYMIRVKDAPGIYISKQNVAYAFHTDFDIVGKMEVYKHKSPLEAICQGDLDDPPHWFTKNQKSAKTWSSISKIKSILTYAYNHECPLTEDIHPKVFSHYELIVVHNGKVEVLPLQSVFDNPKEIPQS